MKKGEFYFYEHLEMFATNHYSMKTYGPEVVQRHIVIIYDDNEDIQYTFLLSSANSKGYIYECVGVPE